MNEDAFCCPKMIQFKPAFAWKWGTCLREIDRRHRGHQICCLQLDEDVRGNNGAFNVCVLYQNIYHWLEKKYNATESMLISELLWNVNGILTVTRVNLLRGHRAADGKKKPTWRRSNRFVEWRRAWWWWQQLWRVTRIHFLSLHDDLWVWSLGAIQAVKSLNGKKFVAQCVCAKHNSIVQH